MIVTVANGKGGVAKSTTCAEFVSYLAQKGRRVIAFDADRNGDLTHMCGVREDAEVEAVAAHVFKGEATIEQAAIEAPTIPGALVVPGTHDLNAVTGTAEQLAERLRRAAEGCDVVIDTRPGLELLTEAALMAADIIVVVASCDVAAIRQTQGIDTFLALRGRELDWVVPCRQNSRAHLHKEAVELFNQAWPGRVTNPIPEAVEVQDAYAEGKTVSRYKRWGKPARCYRRACATIMQDQESKS